MAPVSMRECCCAADRECRRWGCGEWKSGRRQSAEQSRSIPLPRWVPRSARVFRSKVKSDAKASRESSMPKLSHKEAQEVTTKRHKKHKKAQETKTKLGIYEFSNSLFDFG